MFFKMFGQILGVTGGLLKTKQRMLELEHIVLRNFKTMGLMDVECSLT